MKQWPKRHVAGHFNEMALCTRCDRDATQAPFTHYVEQAINRGPYLCDDCLKAEEETSA